MSAASGEQGDPGKGRAQKRKGPEKEGPAKGKARKGKGPEKEGPRTGRGYKRKSIQKERPREKELTMLMRRLHLVTVNIWATTSGGLGFKFRAARNPIIHHFHCVLQYYLASGGGPAQALGRCLEGCSGPQNARGSRRGVCGGVARPTRRKGDL